MRSTCLGGALAALYASGALANELPPCLQLEAIETPSPPYPTPEQARAYLKGTKYMHIFVEGSVVVEFTVAETGAVSNARIIEAIEKPIGVGSEIYAQGYFDGFLEMNVLPTVKQWRYKPIERSCRKRFTITYKLQEDV